MTEDQLREARPFLAAIVAAPGDALPRHIFADWLEERGMDTAASGQRWAADRGIKPTDWLNPTADLPQALLCQMIEPRPPMSPLSAEARFLIACNRLIWG